MLAKPPIGGEGAAGACRIMQISRGCQDNPDLIGLSACNQGLDDIPVRIIIDLADSAISIVIPAFHIGWAIGASFTDGFDSDIKHEDCLFF